MRNIINEILFLPFRPIFGNMTEPFHKKGEPLLSLAVLSDIHIRREGYRIRRLKRAWKDILKAGYIDGIVLPGDITDHGEEDQWKTVAEICQGYPLPDTVAVMGNHDSWGAEESFDITFERYRRYKSAIFHQDHQKPYFAQQIKGYTFIGLGSEEKDDDFPFFSKEQIAFLNEELQKADKYKPVFVISHYAVNKTHGLPKTFGDKNYIDETGGFGTQSDEINAVLQQHSNVILISGHSHMGICRKQSYSSLEKVGNIHSLNVPCYTFWNHDGIFNSGQGYVIEVYADRICFRPRSFLKRVWLPKFNETIYL